jgi:hydroxymethylbilane synthase
LRVAAITRSVDPYDALVSKNNLKVAELPSGARVGVSSFRRKEQLKAYRKDFQLIDIRGNIGERLEKLNKSGLNAVVIAAAALVRLKLEDRIAQRIPFEILRPHPLQGALAIEARETDRDLVDLLGVIHGI